MKFRSKFEKRVYENTDVKMAYEEKGSVLYYNTPASYTPDFILPNGILIECKGYFDSRSRGKMIRVKKQNPDKDIRFVFQRASNRLTKSPNSMTYGEWADKHGFPWHEGDYVPERWTEE